MQYSRSATVHCTVLDSALLERTSLTALQLMQYGIRFNLVIATWVTYLEPYNFLFERRVVPYPYVM